MLPADAKAVGGVPEHAVLYTRPCGVPSVGREPEKRRFARSLSAHLRRHVQPHRRLLSSTLQIFFKSDGELGERLNFASHIAAEGVARDRALSGSQPTEGTPQGRADQT